MSLLAMDVFNDSKMALAVSSGFSASSFNEVKAALDVPKKVLAEAVHIPERTFDRRQQKHQPLSVDESERLLRFARLFVRAVQVLGNPEQAKLWMQRPNTALGGKTPFLFAQTEPGAREVEKVLGRTEHGVFS